jgi:hypothetical protein
MLLPGLSKSQKAFLASLIELKDAAQALLSAKLVKQFLNP